MGSILKRKTKTGFAYRARVFDDRGNQIYKTFERKKDAAVWIAHTESKRAVEGILKRDKKVSFGEYAEWWLSQRKDKVAVRTIESFESSLKKYILPIFGKKRISEITYQDGVNFQEYLKKHENKLTNISINHIMQRFAQILIYATKGQGYRKQLFSNPFLGIEKLKEGKSKLEYWEKEEISQFLDLNTWKKHSLSLARRAIYVFAINTGARLGEIAGLKKSAIDFKNKVITIDCAMKRERGIQVLGTTKTGNIRHIPMNDVVYNILREICEKLKDNDFVFKDKRNDFINISHFARTFRRDQKNMKMGKIIRFHDLRHTYASHYVMNGGDIFELQKLLGHREISTTMIYAHLSPRHLQDKRNLVSFDGE